MFFLSKTSWIFLGNSVNEKTQLRRVAPQRKLPDNARYNFGKNFISYLPKPDFGKNMSKP